MKIVMKLLLPALFASCSLVEEKQANTDSTSDGNSTIDTIRKVVVIDTIKGTVDVSTPTGIYSATLNNAEYWLQFNDDKTYRLEQKDNKGISNSSTQGNWGIDEDEILLYDNKTVVGKLKRNGDSLYLTEIKAAKAGGKGQLFKKHDLGGTDTSWTNRQARGTEFYGTGNEPFWNIEIDNEKTTSFKMSDWKQAVVVKSVKPIESRDSVYYNVGGPNKMSVTVYKQFCSDGMSDKIYGHKVRVRYKGQTYSGCGEYFDNNKNQK